MGALNLAVAFMFAVAVVTLHRLLMRTVLAGYLFYTVPHLVFHVRHLTGFSTSDAIMQTIVLSITVGAPLTLLGLTKKPQTRNQA